MKFASWNAVFCGKDNVESFHKENKMIGTILGDPDLSFEGTAQQISDAYDQKGVAYCIGYGRKSLALAFTGDKFIEKLYKHLEKNCRL